MANNTWETLTGLQTAHINGREIIGSKPPRRIITYYIPETFGDFRDYTSKTMYLYLPYAGIIELPNEQFVGHTLGIDLYIDCRTGNLKYYITSDNALAFMQEGCIRQTMPVSSQNSYQASLTKLGGVIESGKTFFDIGTGKPLAAGKDMMKGLFDITKPAPMKSSGGFSPSTAINDSTHIYIITVTREVYFGAGIQERYGYPDNQFGTIGSFSGYVEIADAEIQTRATETEQNEILTLLMQGVII